MRSWNIAIEWQAVKVNVTVLNEWDQLKKVRTYLDENLKEDSSDHQSHDRILNSVCIKKEWHKATMCQLQTTQQDN
jgi:hypothetical protein